jgi:broad specificity polyphosphatase/5'/3'-nucleotidase SurE
MYLQCGDPIEREFDDNSRDIDAVRNGFISITPLEVSRTNMAVFEELTK